MALVVLVGITTNNVRNTQHAKLITTATFLARAKMAELEDLVLEEGFIDNDQEEEGDFSDEGSPKFRWNTLIEKVRAARRPGPADPGHDPERHGGQQRQPAGGDGRVHGRAS